MTKKKQAAHNKSFLVLLALVALLFNNFPGSAALATSKFDLGVQAYKARRWNEAVVYFYAAITKEGAGSEAWLYMGHSYLAAGDRVKAQQTYKTLRAHTDKFSLANREATNGLNLISMTDPASFGRAAIGMTPNSSANAVGGGKSGPVERFVVQAPRIGHPEVSPAALNLVRGFYDDLPPSIKQLLVAGNIQIVVTPTMIDKNPAGAYQELAGYGGGTSKSNEGFYTNRQIILALHTINERTDELSAPIPSAEMQITFRHETGHAIDTCFGEYSQSAEFKAAYVAESSKLSDERRSRLSYFLQRNGKGQSETFAELCSISLGNNSRLGPELMAEFPATAKLVQAKVDPLIQ